MLAEDVSRIGVASDMVEPGHTGSTLSLSSSELEELSSNLLGEKRLISVMPRLGPVVRDWTPVSVIPRAWMTHALPSSP